MLWLSSKLQISRELNFLLCINGDILFIVHSKLILCDTFNQYVDVAGLSAGVDVPVHVVPVVGCVPAVRQVCPRLTFRSQGLGSGEYEKNE